MRPSSLRCRVSRSLFLSAFSSPSIPSLSLPCTLSLTAESVASVRAHRWSPQTLRSSGCACRWTGQRRTWRPSVRTLEISSLDEREKTRKKHLVKSNGGSDGRLGQELYVHLPSPLPHTTARDQPERRSTRAVCCCEKKTAVRRKLADVWLGQRDNRMKERGHTQPGNCLS